MVDTHYDPSYVSYELQRIRQEREEAEFEEKKKKEAAGKITGNLWKAWQTDKNIRIKEMLALGGKNPFYEMDPEYMEKGFFRRSLTPSGGAIRKTEYGESIGKPSAEARADVMSIIEKGGLPSQSAVDSVSSKYIPTALGDYGDSRIDVRDIVSKLDRSRSYNIGQYVSDLDKSRVTSSSFVPEGPETIGEQIKGLGKGMLDRGVDVVDEYIDIARKYGNESISNTSTALGKPLLPGKTTTSTITTPYGEGVSKTVGKPGLGGFTQGQTLAGLGTAASAWDLHQNWKNKSEADKWIGGAKVALGAAGTVGALASGPVGWGMLGLTALDALID